MENNNTVYNRRSFITASVLAGGGLLLSFRGFSATRMKHVAPADNLQDTWKSFNGFVKITPDNVIKIMSPNPEGGQNVKTSMPMIVAEELDADWKNVVVEQADLDTKHFTRQFIGGSQAIHQGWKPLRIAGATARFMLIQAAAQAWQVPISEITTANGILYHRGRGLSATYGQFATAAALLPVPADAKLKDPKDFTLIGKSVKNVELKNIITGKPLYGIDVHQPGMLYAMIVHPPAHGLKLKSFDASAVKKRKGVKDVFAIQSMADDYERQFFDIASFPEVLAIVGNSTWEVMQAKKELVVQWMPIETHTEKRNMLGNRVEVKIPTGLESSNDHQQQMEAMKGKPARVRRKDGDPETAFSKASKVLERSYTGPFLAHNCMEPMNFFADVKENKVLLIGPLQKPELTEQTLSKRLGIPVENIDIKMTRLGGGYGRRSYAHWLLEAALISKQVNAPVKLMYSREDDMTGGIYRSAYAATFRAAIDANNQLTAIHVNAGGVPESPLYANRFPAGAVEHYLAEDWSIDTNLTVGSFRAPRSNFMAAAEQSFLDELAETLDKDPIDFRIELFEKALKNPVGKNNEYDPARFIALLKLLKEKSGWDVLKKTRNVGFAAYFCHDSYAAHVVDVSMQGEKLVINKVHAAVDCGLVINPDAARNLTEGAITDGIGAALFGKLTFTDGVPDQQNFNSYRMIRMKDAPKSIEVHFAENGYNPTGMGEPAYPPVFAALANALYRMTGKRYYDQPFGV
jgi:isoquinoline 1-oxidoreductase subunit beta